jgi:hypothetical protein
LTVVSATPDARIGGLWDGSVFSPPPPEPAARERLGMSVSNAQLRIALENAGQLAAFEARAMAAPVPAIIFEYGGQIRRESALIAQVKDATFTDAVIDNLFRAAIDVEM